MKTLFNLGFRHPGASGLCYGYNAFWADHIPVLGLPDHARPAAPGEKMQWGDGFEIETVINCRLAAAGARIVEVPSVERLRLHGQSNLNAMTDGLRVLKTLVTEWYRFRLSRGRVPGAETELPPVAVPVAVPVAA